MKIGRFVKPAAKAYSARADFVYTVTRGLVRGCQTPIRVNAIDAVASLGFRRRYWLSFLTNARETCALDRVLRKVHRAMPLLP
jgi:hypothetical protein